MVRGFVGAGGVPSEILRPNASGDWINQRDVGYESNTPLAARAEEAPDKLAFFSLHSLGVSTNRDAWVYNFDGGALSANVQRTIQAYNDQAAAFKEHRRHHSDIPLGKLVEEFIDLDPQAISWSAGLKQRLTRQDSALSFEPAHITAGLYRPFCRPAKSSP